MTAEWAAVIVAIGSFLLAGLAVVISRRAEQHTDRQSDAAERQAEAAEAQVELMQRQLDQMERAAATGKRVSEVPYVAPWIIRRVGKNQYHLVNAGSTPEFDVRVDLGEQALSRGIEEPFVRIDPRAAVPFMVLHTMASSPEMVTVRWRRAPDGPEKEWSTALS